MPANIRTFKTIPYASDKQAQEDVRAGRLDAASSSRPSSPAGSWPGRTPALGLMVDNSDQFMSSSLETEMQSLTDALNQPAAPQRVINRSPWRS